MMYNVLGWLLLVTSGVFITILVMHVGSDKQLSYKFTIPSVLVISFCLGYGIHFLLLANGI